MATELERITNYDEVTLPLIVRQYFNSDRLRGIIESMNDRADELEQALFEIRDEFWIDTATGAQLDVIGSILGESRLGRNDTDYRAAIKAKAAQIVSGESEGIISVLKSLFGATFVDYMPEYPTVPAQYRLLTDAVVTLAELEVFTVAGVLGLISYPIVDQAGNNLVDFDGNKILAVTPP